MSRGARPRAIVRLHSLYDSAAADWKRTRGPLLHDDLIGRPVVAKLARHLATNGVVLDVGCGDGSFCRMAATHARMVIGVDLSPAMLANARRLSKGYANIEYRQGDFSRLSGVVLPRSVDVSVALYASCCAPSARQLKRLFTQLRSATKDGGSVIVQVPHPCDGLFATPSAWFEDVDEFGSYFDCGQLVRRRLRTVDGKWIAAARFHFPLGVYVRQILAAGLEIVDMLEPRASRAVVARHPSLRREALLPSSVIFVARLRRGAA